MVIAREELDAIFDSPNNEIEDERVMEYDERSKKVFSSLKNEDIKSSGANVKNDDEDISLDTDLSDTALDTEPSDASSKKEDNSNRMEFNFDGVEDDTEEVVIDQDANKDDEKTENLEKHDDKKETKISEEKSEETEEDDDEIDDVEGESEESESEDSTSETVPNNVVQDVSYLEVVCSDKKYLHDPRYLEFYKQKYVAHKFLEDNVPKIDYKSLRKQIIEFHVSVDSEGILSLDEFNEKIQKVQSIRNRLARIRSICIQNYVPTKRVVKLLEDCLMKESPEKTNDKRAGDIQIHLSDMEYDLALSEAFMKDVDQIMENITSAHEALSRQITVLQERNKEIQRGQEPYIDSTANDIDSIVKTPKFSKPKKDVFIGETSF